jgi:hypothetical protein
VIRPSPYGTNALHAGVPTTICGGYTSAAVDAGADGNYTARIYVNGLISVNTSRTYFPTRPAISIRFSTISPDTKYSENDDQIHVDWMSAWGAYGIFGVAHEYGHAVHHIVLGGIKHSSGSCGSDVAGDEGFDAVQYPASYIAGARVMRICISPRVGEARRLSTT